MNTYYLRANKLNFPVLIANGIILGAIQHDEQQAIVATHGGCWDYIGPIYQPTGEPDKDNHLIMTPLVDEDNQVYLHANLRTPLNLADVATQLAVNRPEIADGLSRLDDYFILDSVGHARHPNNPHRVFF